MNRTASMQSALDADPLASVHVQGSAIADLAFGVMTTDLTVDSRRHLAFLPPETLELDLTDPAQRLFGDYELLELLGEGGMGVVYRARQISLEREVAVKLLAAGPWASRRFVERFQREAQDAARMQHPNIVAIYEVGCTEELHFFSMRLINGPSLAALIKKDGPLSPLRAAQLLRTIAEAVDYAHRLGVLHLDLKPANVLLDENGQPHVADFGLARRVEQGLAADNDEVSGTPSYMAPEQATAGVQNITRATDVWGLGAILYELATGQPPFLGASPQATLQLVLEGTLRSPRRYAPELPKDLEAIIGKCMARNVPERYLTGRELADDLARFIGNREVRARSLNVAQRTARWARRERKLATMAFVAVAALLVGLVIATQQWLRAESSAAETRGTLWQARRTAADVAILADDGFAAMQPILTNVGEQEQHDVDASTDRFRIGLELEHAPRLIDMLALDSVPADMAVSPDNSRVAVLTQNSVTLIDPVTAQVIWTQPVPPSELVMFQSNGRAVRVWKHPQGGERYTEQRLRIEDGTPVTLAIPGRWTRNTYAQDGQYALLGDDANRVQLWNLHTGKPLSALQAFATPALSADPMRNGDVLWTGIDNASTARLVAPDWRVRWRVAPLPNDTVFYGFWSPDQRWLANAMESGRVDLLDLDTGVSRVLGDNFGDRAGHVVFSADSQWLVVGSRDHRAKIWNMQDGALMSLPIENEGMVTTVALDDSARLLMTNDDGAPRMWRLPDAPSRFAPAVPVGPRLLARSSFRNTQPLLLLPEQDSAITGGVGNELRFWRLPPNPMRRAHAAPIANADLHFDGHHLLAIDGNQVSVLDPSTEKPLARPLIHPQPVSHAALSQEGATVWVAAGDEVHRWDWNAGRPRTTPVRLPNVVERMALNPQRDEVVVSVLGNRSGHVREMLFRIDTLHERVLATADLPGPLGGLRYSEDGTQVLTWRGQALQPLDAATLAAVEAPLRFNVGTNGRYMDVRADGGVRWANVWNDDGAGEPSSVWHYPIGAREPDWRKGNALSVLVAALGSDGRQAVISPGAYPGHQPQQRFDASGARIALGPRGGGGMAADFSPDGRWIASALPDGVRLYSAGGDAVGPPLRAALDFHDRVEQVAFAPDGASILARTIKGRWLLWSIAADARPVAAIADELHRLLMTADEASAPNAFDAAVRSRLRARDTGARAPAAAAQPDPNLAPPPRAPDTPPTLLDLSEWFTRTAHEKNAVDGSFDLRRLALGRQRIDGLEFDLRGIVQLGTTLPGAGGDPLPTALPRQVDGIQVPPQVAAFDLLMGDFGDGSKLPCLSLILNFKNGAQQRVAIALADPVDGMLPIPDPLQGEATAAPLVLQVQTNQSEYTGARPRRLYRVRIINPAPERGLASIGLYAERNAPYVAAITVETKE